MDWDEVDGVGSVKAITRRQYYWLVAGVFVGLVALEVAVDGYGRHAGWWQRAAFRPWADTWVYWVDYFLARFLVDGELKRRGLSRGGPTVAAWAPAGGGPAGLLNPDAVVEVRSPREISSALGALCLATCLPALALGVGLILQRLKARAPGDGAIGLDGSVLLFLIAVVCGPLGVWLIRRGTTPRLVYRAGPAGFTDCARDVTFPWSSVASYRVTTDHDALGAPTETTHELTGWAGEPLVTLKLDGLPPPARDRLLASLQARLPKPVKDAGWD